MNPYTLPDGNVQISFSGGRTSGYMLHHIIEANNGLPDRARVIFSNTGREMPETLDFVQECGERWNVPITWLEYRVTDNNKHTFEAVNHNSASRNGEPFELLIRKRKYLPNQMMRFCTAELKIRPAIKYLRNEMMWANWHSAIGIRADEQRRLKPSREARTTAWYPLADANVSKGDITSFWREQPFDLMLANVNGRTPLGNCDGCFLKSEVTQSMLARDHPERHAWWEKMEALAGELTSGSHARFRSGYSKQELREFIDAQGDWIFDDENGVLCQEDDGECTG